MKLMKKFTVLFLAAAMSAGTLSAATARSGRAAEFGGVKLSREMSGLTKPAGTRAVIDVQPSGEEKLYSRSGLVLFPFDYDVYEMEDDGFAGVIVFGEGDPATGQKVYIKNPFSQFVTDTFLEGTLVNETITVKFPQDVIDLYDEEYGRNELLKAWIVNINEAGDAIEPDADTENQFYSYVKNEDGGWTPVDGEKIIGLTYSDNTFTGYGEVAQTFTPVTATTASVPEGATEETWSVVSEGVGRTVNVAIADNAVYFKDIVAESEGLSPLVGTIAADGSITVANDQFLGVNEKNCYLYYAFTGKSTIETDEYGEIAFFTPNDAVRFAPDATGDVLTADGDITFTPVADPTVDYYWYEDLLVAPVISRGKVTDTKPATPVITGYNYYDMFGFGYVEFEVPAVNTESQPLNTADIYYNMLVDGKVYTFEPTVYQTLTEPMTDIAWGYTDDVDGMGDFKIVEGAKRSIILYDSEISTVGIQSFYKDPESGDVSASEVATYVVKAGIDGIGAEGAVAVEYYDLAGRRAERPEAGVYIVKVRTADGSVRTSKLLVK